MVTPIIAFFLLVLLGSVAFVGFVRSFEGSKAVSGLAFDAVMWLVILLGIIWIVVLDRREY